MKKRALENKLAAIMLVMLTMWDVYLGGFRVFDFFAIFLLLIFIIFFRRLSEGGIEKRILIALVGLTLINTLFVLHGMLGVEADFKRLLGMLIAPVVVWVVVIAKLGANTVLNATKFAILLHVSVLFSQVVAHYVFGVDINYLAIFGGDQRGSSSVFRPTGFFEEPAHYSLNMFMLVTLRTLMAKEPDRYCYLGLFSVILTLSFWGAITSFIYIMLHIKNIRYIGIVVIFFLVIGFVVGREVISDYSVLEYAYFNRVDRILGGGDSSAQVRYEGLSTFLNDDWDKTHWIGYGYGAESLYGESAVGALLYVGGAFGSVLFLCFSMFFSRKGDFFIQSVFFGVLLTGTASLITIFFFWGWLGFVAGASKLNDGVKK